jgi:oligoribonuclease
MIGIFLDTEANGLDWTKHGVIEISFILMELKTGKMLDSYSSLVKMSAEEWSKSNKTSLSFTGIKFEELKNGKDKEVLRKEILEIFKRHKISRKNSIFIGQNPSFDRVLFSSIISVPEQDSLNWPYLWLDLASMFFAKHANHQTINHLELSKDKIAKFYNLPPEEKPHRALRGVEHLIECYKAVVGNQILNANN